MPVNGIPTPETDKMIAVKDKSQAIGEFIEWLGDNGMAIVRYATKEDMFDDEGERNGIHEGDYLTMLTSIEKLLARYFGVDLNKAEKEKRAILESLQVPCPSCGCLGGLHNNDCKG